MDFAVNNILVETIFIPEDIVRVNQLLRPLQLFIITGPIPAGFIHFLKRQACPFIIQRNFMRKQSVRINIIPTT
jgi:hypothetical protein